MSAESQSPAAAQEAEQMPEWISRRIASAREGAAYADRNGMTVMEEDALLVWLADQLSAVRARAVQGEQDECPSTDHECPCGSALKRNGETVKSHWHGVICEDCEADIFRKAQRRLAPESMFHAFVPEAPHPSDVKALDLSAVKPIDREWTPVNLRPGDRYRQKSTAIGHKAIHVIEVEYAMTTSSNPTPDTGRSDSDE